MGTTVSIAISIVVTVLVSRYYFQRSTRKCLKAYLLVNSEIFAGIEPEVREQLHFAFRGAKVEVLQQVEFLIANVGERAISGLIEPLRLTFPVGVRILDAVILHKTPESLTASVEIESETTEVRGVIVTIDFPLLNKRDYFLVKILLGGVVRTENLECTLLADDLPRSIKFELLPPRALQEKKPKVEWLPIVFAVFLWLIAASEVWGLLLLERTRPDLYPYPWTSYRFSIAGLGLLPAVVANLLFVILGCLAVSAGFEDMVDLGPRFPIPERFRKGTGLGHGPFGSDLNVVTLLLPTIDQKVPKGLSLSQ